MSEKRPESNRITRARSLRETQTVSEGLLWSVFRAKQLCGLKFRRQHPIESWIVDFACTQMMIVIEIDGGYHDNIVNDDLQRQKRLEALGWRVIRFTDKDVEEDTESVARAIASEVNLPYQFTPRKGTGSGMKRLGASNKGST